MDYSPYAQRAKNFISSIFFLSIAYIFYTKQRYYKNFFSDKYYFPFLNASISLFEVFKYLFFIYAICLFLIYFLEKSPKTGKGVYAMIALKKIFLSPIRTFKHGLPNLKNTILSVEPSLLGWIVTLICYPPFNFYANKVITWKSTDFAYFSNPYLFLTINIMILALMGVYSWASISLGFKASNLTHRGIVTKGPYKF